MSDENRNDAGQFTAEPEQKFGLESVEQDAGYTQMPDPAKEADDWSFEGPESEALEIWSAINAEPDDQVEIFYKDEAGNKKDLTEAVTLQRASDDLAIYHGDREADMAALLGKEFAAEIDKLRADRIKTAADAEHFGVPLPKAEKAAVEGAEAATHEPDAFDGVEGLAEETKAALRQPQVREYLEATEREHSEVREAYTAGLENARISHLASLAEIVPHLAGLPPAQFEQGLAILQSADPPAFQRAMNVLGRTNQIVQAQQQAQQHNAHLAYQQFESSVKSEDARLEALVGREVAQEANQALVTYLSDHGIPRNQHLNTVRQNPVLLTAEARQTILKAAKYDAMQNAPKPRPTRAVPPVQRPGVSRPAGEITSENIQSLERELTRTGSIKIAEKLMNARAKGR